MPKRREFTKGQKAAMWRRATVNGTTFCEGCGLALRTWEYDHTIPDALFLDKTRELTIEDGKLLGHCCHRGPEGKTKKDIGVISKAKRNEANQAQIRRKKKPIQSQGFPKTGKTPKIDKSALPTLDRRQLYKGVET